jgi:rRNA maturation RNase YbeY
MAIYFFSEEINFELKEKLIRKRWLKSIATKAGFTIRELNYVFCSDEYLYRMNLEYLNHDTYTDIITFDNSEKEFDIAGDIFVSIDRVGENAQTNNQKVETELNRVLVHGLLHLMGYKDKTKEESTMMRQKEEESINLYLLH